MSKYFDLLTRKAKSKNEPDWAIILERVPSYFSKQNVIKLISEVFPLSLEDSKDLVESTPIVLLDQLSFEIAEQIRRHFEGRDVSCAVTKDAILKRKCYRAVWPTTPNLSSIMNQVAHKETVDVADPIIPDVPATGSLSSAAEKLEELSGINKISQLPNHVEDIPNDMEEKKQLRQLTLDLQRENETLRNEVDRSKASMRDDRRENLSEQIKNLKSEKIKIDETLKLSREEKTSLSIQNQGLQKKIESLETELKQTALLAGESKKCADSQTEMEKGHSETEEERQRYADMIQNLQNEFGRSKQDVSRLNADKQFLVTQIGSLEAKIKNLESERAHNPQVTDQEYQTLRVEAEQYKQKYLQIADELRAIQNETKQIRSEYAQTQKGLSESRLETEELKRMLEQAQAEGARLEQELDGFREKMESRLQDKNLELEEWKRKANEWSMNHASLLRESEQTSRQLTEELESFRVRNQQLTNQLEQLQRQNRDFVSQLEQQELVQKRMKMTADIAEKEMRLKELTQKQRQIEEDVRFQESTLKEVVSEQSLLENEMIKMKQPQKYMIEQAKKREKGRISSNKIQISDPSSNGDHYDSELTPGDEPRDVERGL